MTLTFLTIEASLPVQVLSLVFSKLSISYFFLFCFLLSIMVLCMSDYYNRSNIRLSFKFSSAPPPKLLNYFKFRQVLRTRSENRHILCQQSTRMISVLVGKIVPFWNLLSWTSTVHIAPNISNICLHSPNTFLMPSPNIFYNPPKSMVRLVTTI